MERKGFLINKAFKKYLWASILTVAATQIANIIDASLVGNIIGSEGLAAVIISQPVLQAIFAVSCIYVSSCAMITGMALGNGERDKANSMFSFSLAVSVIVGIIIAVGGLLFVDPLLDILCKSDNLRPLAKPFMTITILSALPQLLMYSLQQFVALDGSPKLITRAVTVGNIVNIMLDIIFMKYLGMGIAGAAWATFTMYIVCCLMVLPHFRKSNTLRVCLSKIKEHVNVKKIGTLGLPLFLSTVLLSLQMACYNNIATSYLGDHGLYALAVCMQLFGFSMIILSGTLRTIQPVGAILKGTGDNKGMIILLTKAYSFMASGLVVYAAAITFFPTEIAALLGVTDEATLPYITKALPAFSLNIIMQALLYNLMPIYQFYDHHRLALFLSVAQTLLPVVGFWLLAETIGNTGAFFNVWWGFFLGQLATAIGILVWTYIIRRKNRNLVPICLIPRSEYASLEFSFAYSETEMHSSFKELSAWLKSQTLSDSTIFKIRIIAEELMSNIIRHSEQKEKNAYADVRIVVKPECVTFVLTDSGIPFNPIENKDKGYGLMIANGAASEINYKFQFGQNMTTVVINNA